MICSSCGNEIASESIFCEVCGCKQDSRIQEENIEHVCPNCGAPIEDGNLFCGACGCKLESNKSNKENRKKEEGNFCFNCGYTIPNGSRFCPECGATNRVDIKNRKIRFSINNNKVSSKISNKANKIIALFFAIGIVVCIIVAAISAFYKPTINLNKYVDVAFDGYNSLGRATVVFNIEKMANKYSDDISGLGLERTSNNSDDLEWEYDKMNYFINKCVKYSIDYDENLSNGDEVKLRWECNDQLAKASGIKLKYEDISYNVEGLKQAEYFDPFDGLEVIFSGFSSDGRAEIIGNPTNPATKELYYELSKSRDLSNGDEVVLYVSGRDDVADFCMENYGVIPEEVSKIYVVNGLDTYVSSLNDISDESLEEMQNQAKDVFEAYMAKEWDTSTQLLDFNYIGNYLLKAKNNESWNNNSLILVYEVETNNYFMNEDGDSYDEDLTYYWFISFKNLLVNNNGKTTVNITEYNIPSTRFEIDSEVTGGWNSMRWYYYGYKTLDELYKDIVLSNLESYNHEDGIN